MSEIERKRDFHNLRRSFIGGSDARIIMGKDETGVRAKRSKSGAISFDLLAVEGSHATI